MNIDTSLELHIYRAGNGIKLLHPNPTTDRLNSIHLRDTKHTLGSMLELPLSVYFIGTNSVNQQVNEHDALLSGFDSVKNAIGKKCFNAFTKESASIPVAYHF